MKFPNLSRNDGERSRTGVRAANPNPLIVANSLAEHAAKRGKSVLAVSDPPMSPPLQLAEITARDAAVRLQNGW